MIHRLVDVEFLVLILHWRPTTARFLVRINDFLAVYGPGAWWAEDCLCFLWLNFSILQQVADELLALKWWELVVGSRLDKSWLMKLMLISPYILLTLQLCRESGYRTWVTSATWRSCRRGLDKWFLCMFPGENRNLTTFEYFFPILFSHPFDSFDFRLVFVIFLLFNHSTVIVWSFN